MGVLGARSLVDIWQIVSKALKLVVAFESSILLMREEAKERIKSVQRFRKMMSIRSLFMRVKMRSVSSRGGSGHGRCPWPGRRMRVTTVQQNLTDIQAAGVY